MNNLCFVGEKEMLDEEVPHDECNLCTTSEELAENGEVGRTIKGDLGMNGAVEVSNPRIRSFAALADRCRCILGECVIFGDHRRWEDALGL
jgi:hypothetical protein